MALTKFNLLCSDVTNEIESRFPNVINKYIQKHGEEYTQKSPQPREIPRLSEQSAPIIGGIRTVSKPSHENYQLLKQVAVKKPQQPSRGQLDHLMNDIGNIDYEDDRREVNELKNQIEVLSSKSASDSLKIKNLEMVIESMTVEKKEMELVMDKMSLDFANLKEEYENLQDDYEHQKVIANDIRMEASNLLIEIKNLQAKNQIDSDSPVPRLLSQSHTDDFQNSLNEFTRCAKYFKLT